mgnify:CR=1 FL=1
METKQTIVRKDGIAYERKCKHPRIYNKCICVRISEEMNEKLKKYGKPCSVIRKITLDFLEKGDK